MFLYNYTVIFLLVTVLALIFFPWPFLLLFYLEVPFLYIFLGFLHTSPPSTIFPTLIRTLVPLDIW